MVNEVLRDLMDNENSRQDRASRASGRSSGTSRKKVDESLEMKKQLKPPIKTGALQKLTTMGPDLHLGDEDTVSIGEIDTTKPLSGTTSILEFFLTGLSRNLSLRPK